MIRTCSTRHSLNLRWGSRRLLHWELAFCLFRGIFQRLKPLLRLNQARQQSNPCLSIVFFSSLFLLPIQAVADVEQVNMAALSDQAIPGSLHYQTLGVGLRGSLKSIDIAYLADTTYYGVIVDLTLEECESERYEGCRQAAYANNQGGWDGIRSFDINDYELKPDKYYRLLVAGSGPWGSMGKLFFYGSQEDLFLEGNHVPATPADLYFILHGADRGEIKTACCSSVAFIPGLQSSRLYGVESSSELSGEIKLWEPVTIGGALISRLYLDDRGSSLRSDIYTKDIIGEAVIPWAGPNVYKSFVSDMNSLKNEGAIDDWRPLPYEWRLSVDEIVSGGFKDGEAISYLRATSSPYMIQTIKELAEKSKTGKVTLVAHSNGGLIAKALMMKLSDLGLDHIVDKIILVAVPQTGTPMAIGALLHGFDQGFPLLVSAKAIREFGKNMPGAYGLLPSFSYFDSVSDPVITFDGEGGLEWFDKSKTLFTKEISVFSSLEAFLRAAEGREVPQYSDLQSPLVLNESLLDQASEIHKRIDAWIPPTNVEVIQIAGWGLDTVKGLRYFQGMKKGKPVISYEPLITEDGDGTVVVPSALEIATSTDNVKRYWLNIAKINDTNFPNRKHSDIFELKLLRDFISELIKGEDITNDERLTVTNLHLRPNKKLRFFLHSTTATLDMFDSEGRHTGEATTTGETEEEIPGSTYQKFGDVSYISISSESVAAINRISQPRLGRSALHISIRPLVSDVDLSDLETEGSFTLKIEESEGDQATSTTYADIPLATSTVAIVDVADSIADFDKLEVDTDGDGDIDAEVLPGETFKSAETSNPSHLDQDTVSAASVEQVKPPSSRVSRSSSRRSETGQGAPHKDGPSNAGDVVFIESSKDKQTEEVPDSTALVTDTEQTVSEEIALVNTSDVTNVDSATDETASVFAAIDSPKTISLFQSLLAKLKLFIWFISDYFTIHYEK